MLAVLVICAFLTPGVPIAISWMHGSGPKQPIPLYAATFSFAWLIAGSLFPVTLAGYYTTLRFGLIYANLIAMLVCAVVAFAKKAGRSLTTGIACLMLATIWLFVAAINATV